MALVIAEDIGTAKDAAGAVEVNYEVLDAIVDPKAAVKDLVHPQVHDECSQTIPSLHWELGIRMIWMRTFDQCTLSNY